MPLPSPPLRTPGSSPFGQGSTLKVTPVERVECIDGTFDVDWRIVYPILYNLYLWQNINTSAKVTNIADSNVTMLDVDWDSARRTAADTADTLLKDYRRLLWQRRSRMELLQSLLKAYKIMGESNRDAFTTRRKSVEVANIDAIASQVATMERWTSVMESIRDLSVAGLVIGATFITGPAAAAAITTASGLSGWGQHLKGGKKEDIILAALGTAISGAGGRLAGVGAKMIATSLASAMTGALTYRETIRVSEQSGVQVNHGMVLLQVSAGAVLSAGAGMAGLAPGKTAGEKVFIFTISTGLDTASDAMTGLAQGKTYQEIARTATIGVASKALPEIMSMESVEKMLKRGVHKVGVRKDVSAAGRVVPLGSGHGPSAAAAGKNAHDAVVKGLGKVAETTFKGGVDWATAAGSQRSQTGANLPLIGSQDVYEALIAQAIRRVR